MTHFIHASSSAILLALSAAGGVVAGWGCSDHDESKEGVASGLGLPLSAGNITALWANDGSDKVTRDELRVSRDGKNVLNTAWDGTSVKLFGLKNEVVNCNLVLEALAGANNVSVAFSSLIGPNGSTIASVPASGNQVFNFVGRNIEQFYVRYLQIKGLSALSYDITGYDERHVPTRFRRPLIGERAGSGGWQDRPDHDKFYPEIAVPLELVPTFSIPAASNQSIWTDVYIPKTAVAGLYQGEIAVSQGATVTYVPMELQVYDAALPDMPTAKTMLYISSPNINHRYLGSTWIDPNSAAGAKAKAIRDRHFLVAHRHRFSLIGDVNGGDCASVGDRPCPEWEPRLNGSLFTAANGYDGPGVNTGNNVYSIATYGSWGWQAGGQTAMNQHTDAWATWFNQNSPATERFLYLIDESADTAQIETWAKWMLNNPGPGGQLKSMATIPLTTAAAKTPSLDIPTSSMGVGISEQWQPLVNRYTQDSRKRFYMYNGSRPATGSTATEDDGVALRERAWAQYKLKVSRWFFWETTYYNEYQGGTGETNVFQSAHTFGSKGVLDPVKGETGWNYSNGDGVLLYPGTDMLFPSDSYGVDGPFASLRLKHWRRGLQDVDYLTMASAINPAAVQSLMNTMVPKAAWEYGVTDTSDPTYIHTDIGWSTDPDTWETARRQLAEIIAHSTPTSLQVAMTAPANAATVSGAIVLSATASDAAGVAGVQFFVDGVALGNDVTAAPYNMTFDTRSIADGTHSFAARARNTSNVTATSASVTATVNNNSTMPGRLSLVSALVLSPASPTVNQVTGATFTIQNSGEQALSVQYVFVGARDPSNGHVDFPVSSPVTLQPGQQFTYQGSRTFTTDGPYTAWPAYYDGTNWIDLAPTHTNFAVTRPTPTTLRLEENDPAVVKGPGQWNWGSGTDANASGGSHIASAGAGSTLRLTFTGTGITWIGIADSCTGQATVDLDGVSQMVDGYRASGGGWQRILYSVAGLAATSHTFTLTVLGTKNAGSCGAGVDVDALELVGQVGGAPPPIRIEETSPDIVKGPGQWNWSSGTDANASGGSHIASAGAGSTLRLTFTGTGFTWIGIADSCTGQATVDVDGVSQTVDGYRASGGGWQRVLYSVAGLAATSHTFTLTVLGTKNPGSCGAWVDVDAFDVRP